MSSTTALILIICAFTCGSVSGAFRSRAASKDSLRSVRKDLDELRKDLP